MKPAPAWQRRPKPRATVPPIPAAPPALEPADRATQAEQWRADCARRAAIVAGAESLTEQARRLFAAGEIGAETARSLGADV